MKKRMIIAAAAMTAAITLTACGQQVPTAAAPAALPPGDFISVEASEEVKVVPDVAEIIFAVETQNEDPGACQQQNAQDSNKVIEMIKSAGIGENSVQTSGYGLSPMYDWIGDKQIITGYEMTTEITVSDIPIDQSGDFISQAVSTGVNSIRSVTYLSSKYDGSYDEALRLAIDAARGKAEVMAAAGGFKLGGIKGITEYGQSSPARYTTRQYSAKKTEADGMALDSAAVMPGQVAVEASITVQFAIE